MRRHVPWTHMPLEWALQLLDENEKALRKLEKERAARGKRVKAYRSLCHLFQERYQPLCYQTECTRGLQVGFDPTGRDEECAEVTGVPFNILPSGLQLRPYEGAKGWTQETLSIPLEKIVCVGVIDLVVPVARPVHPSYAAWANSGNVA